MGAASLTSLRELFANKRITTTSLQGRKPRRLNCRQRLLQKYEPSLPIFSSFLEEIEWRLADLSVRLFKGEDDYDGIAYHWIRVAIFAGYKLDRNGYLIARSKKSLSNIYLVPKMRELWEEVFMDCLLAIRLKETQQLQETKRFLCAESSGRVSIREAIDLFEIVHQFFGVGNKIDAIERKRCSSMLNSVGSYRHLITGLHFQSKRDMIVITQNEKFGFYEIAIKEQRDDRSD